MRKIEADVCIVGAGPGGILLAYLLAQKNANVLLLESSNGLGKAFRGEHLNEEGESVLKRHRLFDAVEEKGLLKMEMLQYWDRGKVVKEILPDAQIGHLGIHVPQVNLLTAIHEKACAFPNYQLLLNTRVKDLIADDTGSYTGVIANQKGELIEIKSTLIIGADGRYSTIRKKAAIETKTWKHGFDLLWARIPQPMGWEPCIRMALVEGKQLSLFTQAENRIQIGWNIDEGSFAQIRKQPFTPFIEQLIAHFPMLEQSVRNTIKSWDDFVLLDVFSSSSDKWYKNNLLLLGDAVHTMTPTGAFGLNSSLADAELLATSIEKNYLNDENLLTCMTRRKEAVVKLQQLQLEKERSFANAFVVMS